MYSDNSQDRNHHVPMLIDVNTREVFAKETDSFGNEKVISLGSNGQYAVPEDYLERSRRELPSFVNDSHLSCDKNASLIRLGNITVPVLLFVDNQSLSDTSFDLLTTLVSRIKVDDFNTIETAVSCLNGFEKRNIGFIPLDDKNSRFAMDGYLHFVSPSGKLKVMYFQVVEFIKFYELYKEIEGRPDFDERHEDLRILRNHVVHQVYAMWIPELVVI